LRLADKNAERGEGHEGQNRDQGRLSFIGVMKEKMRRPLDKRGTPDPRIV